MPSVLTQFHADPAESMAFAQEMVGEFNLFFAVMRFFPRFRILGAGTEKTVAELARRLGRVDRICLTRSRPNMSCRSPYEFAQENEEAMALGIAYPAEDGLRQSALSAYAEDRVTLRLWRRITRHLRARTVAGAWVINDGMGTRAFERTFRHTLGARQLASNGVKMLAIAGGNRVEFWDREHEE